MVDRRCDYRGTPTVLSESRLIGARWNRTGSQRVIVSMVDINLDAVNGVANVLNSSSDVIGGLGKKIDDFAFGAGSAGRNHADDGTAVAAGYERLAESLRAWSRSSADIGNSIRGNALNYQAQDDTNSRAVRGIAVE